MKILQLQDNHEVDLGEYGPACEGFVDMVKSLFVKKDAKEAKAEAAHKSAWRTYGMVSKDLEGDLRNTYDNPGWVEKNLDDKAERLHIPALAYANVDGKMITNPREMVKVARGMLNFVKTVAQREKPHTELRIKLCDEAEHIFDNDELDELWEKNASQLKQSPVDRVHQWQKSPVPALGYGGKYPWPIDFNNPKLKEFSHYARTHTTGELEAPIKASAKEFAESIRELLTIAQEAEKIWKDNHIPYWDGLQEEISYDDLEYGDEIFNQMFSSQRQCEVSDLASCITDVVGPIICGLYIAMFNKKLVERQPATEGFLDYFRSKVKTGPTAQPIERFDIQSAWKRCSKFLADPGQFQLTSKSFTPDDKLKLSINGQGPRPEEIAPALAKMFKEASAVNERMAKNAKAYARLAGPLVQKFERTVVGAMDREGNLPQEVLDEAMKPLVANAERVRDSNGFVAFMEKEASKYDGWIGGNPVHPKQVDFRGHAHLDIDYDLKPIPVAVGKARDVKQLQDILTVLFEYIDVDVSFPMLKGALNDEELGEVDAWFEWDRPVRHLWDMMSEEQRNAIGMIYAHEDTSATIFSRIEDRAHDVMYSVFKYVDQSIASL
jgi:hypothetical protein